MAPGSRPALRGDRRRDGVLTALRDQEMLRPACARSRGTSRGSGQTTAAPLRDGPSLAAPSSGSGRRPSRPSRLERTDPPAVADLLPTGPVARFALDDGLEVILQADRSTALASWQILYAVGAGDDPAGYRGLTHLSEHLTYGATRNVRQRLGDALDAITPAWLADEQEIVCTEHADREGDDPTGELSHVVQRALFHEGHRYHDWGDRPGDVRAVTVAGAQWFVQRWYVPSCATMSIVGNIDLARTRAMIERYLGDIPRAPRPAPTREAGWAGGRRSSAAASAPSRSAGPSTRSVAPSRRRSTTTASTGSSALLRQ